MEIFLKRRQITYFFGPQKEAGSTHEFCPQKDDKSIVIHFITFVPSHFINHTDHPPGPPPTINIRIWKHYIFIPNFYVCFRHPFGDGGSTY